MIEEIPCFECDLGSYEVKFIDYEAIVRDKKMIIPKTKIFICRNCGDEMFDSEGMDHIEKYRFG